MLLQLAAKLNKIGIYCIVLVVTHLAWYMDLFMAKDLLDNVIQWYFATEIALGLFMISVYRGL